MGVDPNEWFDNVPHPHDTMPIATNESLPNVKLTFGGCYNYERLKAEGLVGKDLPKNMYAPPEKLAELQSMNTKPPEKKKKEEVKKTPHHIAYEIATAKYNPFAVGGSESIRSIGGSENASSK